MKKGKITSLCAIGACMCLITGCVDNMPDLTAEQSELIAEYAADLLLKYSPNYNYKLVDDVEMPPMEIPTEEPIVESTTEEATEETSTEEASTEESTSEDIDEEGNTVEVVEDIIDSSLVNVSKVDFSELLGLEDLEVSYESFDILDTYPENGKGFVVKSSNNSKLMVLHFTIKNTTNDSVLCDIFEKDIDAKANINGSGYVEALSTILVNDLTTLKEEIGPSNDMDVVLLFNTNAKEQDDIESLVLRLSCEDEPINITIK